MPIHDVADLARAGEFWAAVLGQERPQQSGQYLMFRRVEGEVGFGLQEVPEPKRGKTRAHVDLAVADLEASVRRAEALGGRRLETIVENGSMFAVMVDPDGNEFCLVVEGGSNG